MDNVYLTIVHDDLGRDWVELRETSQRLELKCVGIEPTDLSTVIVAGPVVAGGPDFSGNVGLSKWAGMKEWLKFAFVQLLPLARGRIHQEKIRLLVVVEPQGLDERPIFLSPVNQEALTFR
jgi:hypothetical protein